MSVLDMHAADEPECGLSDGDGYPIMPIQCSYDHQIIHGTIQQTARLIEVE